MSDTPTPSTSTPTPGRGTLIATHIGTAAASALASALFTAEASRNEALLEVVKQAGIGGAMVTLTLGFAFAILQTRERNHREESAERSATFARAFEIQGQAHEKDRAASERIAEALGKVEGAVGEMRGTMHSVQVLVAELLRNERGS